MINSNRFDFSDAVKQTLRHELNITAEGISVIIPQVAKEACKKLKETSPRRAGKSQHLYSKNWKWKYEKGRLTCEAIVYGGKPTYRLAHLLEHGHAKRGGGRVSAIEHIKPVADWANDEAANRIVEYLSRNYGS